jgi:Zn-dependent peptidase ImmA (M78 family)
MAKKQPNNQLGLDFSVRGDRMIYVINDESNRDISRQLFDRLLRREWELEPAGETADVSSGMEEIRTIGHRLLYPEKVKIARVFGQPQGFQGFSAIYNQKGWAFVNAEADSYERRFAIYLLVATLGLYPTYPQEDSLKLRAEQIVFDVLMPEKDMRTFLPDSNTTLSSALASDMSDFFKVPYSRIPERAAHLGLISAEQMSLFPKVRPQISNGTKEIFISHDSSIADDLENYLFGNGSETTE